MSDSFLAGLDAITQSGRGTAAVYVGQSFDVYRLGPSSDSAGIVGNGSLVAVAVTAAFARAKNDDVDTNFPGRALFFAGEIDMTTFAIGDVFVQRVDSFRPLGLIYTCAENRATPRPPIFVATPRFATMQRPSDVTSSSAQFTTTPGGPAIGVGFDQTSRPTNDVLALVAGQYAWAPETSGAIPARFPIGLQPTARLDGARPDALPTSDFPTRYLGYVPDLPGVEVEANNILYVGDDEYTIVSISTNDASGLSGTLVVLERDGV